MFDEIFNEKSSFFIQAFSLLFFVIFFIWDKYLEKRKKYEQKLSFLKAVYKELEWNSQWVKNVFEDEKDQISYYDTTRADFLCENTALKAYLLNKDSFFTKKQELTDSLVYVNGAIKHYNQQVLEQHDCRFADPEITGFATNELFKNPDILKDWMCCEEKRPEKIKFFLSEIRLRNWAINKGKKDFLKPAIIKALNLVDGEIRFVESKKGFKKLWQIIFN